MEIIDTKLEFKDEMKLRDTNKIYLIILHHRAGHGDVQSIHDLHLKRKYAGIGYHFYIRQDGIVYKGRPVKYIGAHCKDNNSLSIGICLEGDFRVEQPTPEQLDSLSALVRQLKMEYPRIKRVLNHKDFMATACPVIDLKTLVKGINKDGSFRKNY